MSERIFRVVSLGLFVVGFVGAIASADRHPDLGMNGEQPKISVIAEMVEDIKAVQEANSINDGTWNQDVAAVRQDGFARVQAILEKQEQEETQLKSESTAAVTYNLNTTR